MKKPLILCSVLILLVLGGMLYMNYSEEKAAEEKQNKQMFHKAEQVAITYFKEERDKNLIVKKTDFAKHGFDYIEVSGYAEGDEHTQYLVNVSYNQNYRITSIAERNEKN
jgi:hypothetical protein